MLHVLFTAALLTTSMAAVADVPHGGNGNDRASFGQDITIGERETAGDVACAFCSVHLHGDAHGDVAVLFGSVEVDEGRSIGGDVAVLGGDARLAENAQVNGDAAIAAGSLEVAEGASVHGSRAVLPGRFWLLMPFALLLVLVGVLWLIVWAVRRNRYPRMYAPQIR